MPRTNAVPSLMLMFRRADVAAFAILGTAMVSSAVWVAAAGLDVERPWVWGAAAGVTVLVPGVLWTPWFEIGIRAWNKVMRGAITAQRAYVLRVCYYVVVTAVGRAGSSLDLSVRPAAASKWVRYDDTGRRGAHFPEVLETMPWYRAAYTSGRSGGNRWVICLLPVVLLLRVLTNEWSETGTALLSATYTLY